MSPHQQLPGRSISGSVSQWAGLAQTPRIRIFRGQGLHSAGGPSTALGDRKLTVSPRSPKHVPVRFDTWPKQSSIRSDTCATRSTCDLFEEQVDSSVVREFVLARGVIQIELDHVVTIAKTPSQKPGVLFRCRKLYTPEQLPVLYKAQKRAFRLIDTPIPTQAFTVWLAGLSLFYRFYHGRCSRELSQIITPKAVRTKRGSACFPYQVEVLLNEQVLTTFLFLEDSTLWNVGFVSDGYNCPASPTHAADTHNHIQSQEEKIDTWPQKALHGKHRYCVTQDYVNEQQSYTWLHEGQLLPETEVFMLAIQDQEKEGVAEEGASDGHEDQAGGRQ
nr:unnamed protein product [Callosobruchus analis]